MRVDEVALSLREARATVDDGPLSSDAAFQVLAAIGRHGALDERHDARDLLIRVLERAAELPTALQDLLEGLLREHGLFPYLTHPDHLGLADRLAYELHRPQEVPGRDLVFHAEQAAVYRRLMAGENVVLSAPTSFGKSLVIDAVLAARDFRNVVVVVPTLALMDEARRRLSQLEGYKVITHGSQTLGPRNLIVMTQERLLDVDLPAVDFFVVDEFYKLDPAHSDDRSSDLNIVLRRLLQTGAQYYLLGPSITALADGVEATLRATFITTGFTTVATEFERVAVPQSELPDELARVCQRVGPGTLFYTRSPARAGQVADWLIERGVGGGRDLDGAAEWLGAAYHPEWVVTRALRRGIGVHHGRLPRALGHHLVRLFDEGRLPYLVVTSTLIEGVNTSARNVLVLDHTIAQKKYDYFTYANIRGRSGRMFHHFVGRVVVFNPEPRPADLVVDVPVLSQPRETNERILIQLPLEDMSPSNAERMRPYFEQDLVPVEVLRLNSGTAPAAQVAVAREMEADPVRWERALDWGRFPSSQQVKELAPTVFALAAKGAAGANTSAQLAAKLNILRYHDGDVRAVVDREVQRGLPVNEAVEQTLAFTRNWAQFHVPAALAAIERLASAVLGSRGSRIAATSLYSGQLQNLFQQPFASVLEEYGLPTQLSAKLRGSLRLHEAETLDDALTRLAALPRRPRGLTAFEMEMLDDARSGL